MYTCLSLSLSLYIYTYMCDSTTRQKAALTANMFKHIVCMYVCMYVCLFACMHACNNACIYPSM